MNLFRIYLLAALAGCSIVSQHRVDGWPSLAVIEHRVSEAKLRDVCDPNANPFVAVSVACVTFDLKRGQCHYWQSKDFPPPSWVREHELKHCDGYDHVGGTTMARYLRGDYTQ